MLPGSFCIFVSPNSASFSKLGECGLCSAFNMEVGQGCSVALRARGPVRGGQVRPAGSGGGVGGRRGEADGGRAVLTPAWPGCWGGMGRGRADGAGSECSVRTRRLPEYVSLVLQGRESWPPSARAENVEGPGLLELGGLVDCLCPRWWWELLTFLLGW